MSKQADGQATFVVDAVDVGQRLDVVLARRIEGIGRTKAAELVSAQQVRVNGKSVHKSYVLRAADQITVDVGAEDRALPDASVALQIVLETPNYLVVNKPSGMPTHPLSPGELGTLVNGLLHRFPEIADVGYHAREPGVVHRLDTFTSGLLLVARNQAAFEALHRLLKEEKIEKIYIALCHGQVKAPQEIAWSLYPDRRHPDRVKAWKKTVVPNFRLWPARTEILSSKALADYSQVELRAHRAFRHQLRVHLATIGHPIVGDTIYGNKDDTRPDDGKGQMLHASEISFVDPWSAQVQRAKAPINFLASL